jgi:hypothetical protein
MERGVDDTRPMTGEQAAMLKRLAYVAYELDAFKPSLMRVEADVRIATALARRGRIYPVFLGNSGNLRFTHVCGRPRRNHFDVGPGLWIASADEVAVEERKE